MERGKSGQIITIIALALVVVVMSVGYANLAQDVTETGTVTLAEASWNVHFDSSTYSDTADASYISATAHSFNTDTTALTYSVSLNPGERYHSTVNVVNDGTLAAKLNTVTASCSGDACANVTYTVNVDAESFPTTGTATTASGTHSTLVKNSGTNTVTVDVYYNVPTSTSELLTEAKTVTINLTANYIQDTN